MDEAVVGEGGGGVGGGERAGGEEEGMDLEEAARGGEVILEEAFEDGEGVRGARPHMLAGSRREEAGGVGRESRR